MRSNPSHIHVRLTHPTLFRYILAGALFDVALAVNYWRFTPTFNPKVIFFTPSKDSIAVLFLVLGVSQFLFLKLHDLPKVRFTNALAAGVTFAWACCNTQQAFAGKSSLALPIALVFVFVVQRLSLIEAPVNPLTKREQ